MTSLLPGDRPGYAHLAAHCVVRLCLLPLPPLKGIARFLSVYELDNSEILFGFSRNVENR